MKIMESKKIQEKAYLEKLKNGLTIVIIPKQTTRKKYVIWGTHFGSIDNHFRMPGSGEEVFIPDGVAHFLEHKMFEQPNGTNSLDTLMALGVDANAYTTNDHTAYLFECTDHFEEAIAELMDYVQHHYFTDENVGLYVLPSENSFPLVLYGGVMPFTTQNYYITFSMSGNTKMPQNYFDDTKAYWTDARWQDALAKAGIVG